MAAHSFIADRMSGLSKEIIEAIRDGKPVSDPGLAALHDFTRTLVVKRGLPDPGDVESFLRVGYTERHILEIILAISVKTLSNYANHLFHTPVDGLFSEWKWSD